MEALVVNCSVGREPNLGAHKLADWLRDQGHTVTAYDGDPGPLLTRGFEVVALSVVFSWHATVARDIALRVKANSEVWCGGPGMTALRSWWKAETGLTALIGVDHPWERQRGQYGMTFASRGCPVGCSFCVVPKLEGRGFTLDPEFIPAPKLADNNLSALPVEYQQHIIDRYQAFGQRLEDANSGFEPRSFDGGTFERWAPALRGPWRFAFDEMGEREEVEAMMLGPLAKVANPRRKRPYVLIGNEPMEACYERALKTLEWGGEPHVQWVIKLNALEKTPWVRFDWTEQRLRDFARYFNRRGWKYGPLSEYRGSGGTQYAIPPFEGVL